MPKAKSSASSGTRKKHARKAAGPAQAPDAVVTKEKKSKGKEKGKNKEPRQKAYIPPFKPAPIQPDPLDTMGLAHQLPPELLVILRRFGKKDAVTKRRALEEFQSGWVDEAKKEGDDSSVAATLVIMVPVWLHHTPSLFTHPSKRIRLLTAGLHNSLLHIPVLREQIIFFIRETASTDQAESILGAWCIASHDIDRQVGIHALKSWNDVIGQDDGKLVLDRALLPSLISFVQRTLLDPAGVYLYLNPAPPAVPQAPSKKVPGRAVPAPTMKREDSDTFRTKGEGDDENELDRKARLRVGAFRALTWILTVRSKTANDGTLDDVMDLLCNPALWSSLHHAETSPLAPDLESFGWNQPAVRKSAWSTLQCLLQNWKGSITSILPIISTAVLRSAWVEPDPTVRTAMWPPLLTLLKEFPDAWNLAGKYESEISAEHDEDNSDSEDTDAEEETTPDPKPLPATATIQTTAYREFLQFLELGCAGSPSQGYPTVVIILSTLASPIIAPLTDFFTSFWAAIDGRALSALDRSATNAAFLSSLLECMVFLVRRLRNDTQDHAVLLSGTEISDAGGLNGSQSANWLVGDQFGKVWDELVANRLKVQPGIAAKLMAQTLVSLEKLDGDLFHSAWSSLASAVKKEVQVVDSSPLAPTVLKFFDEFFEDDSRPKLAVDSLIREIVQWSFDQCDFALKNHDEQPSATEKTIESVVRMIDTFGPRLFHDADFTKRIDEITFNNANRLLSIAPSLLLVYLTRRDDQSHCLALWQTVLSCIAQNFDNIDVNMSSVLKAAHTGTLPAILKPKGSELDTLVGSFVADVLDGSAIPGRTSLVRQVLATPGYFLSESAFTEFVKNITSSFAFQVDLGLREPSVSLHSFEPSLDLLLSVSEARTPHSLSSEYITSVLPDVFIFAFLFPQFYSTIEGTSIEKAQRLWSIWSVQSQGEKRALKLNTIKKKLRALLINSQVLPTAHDILLLVFERKSDLEIDLLRDIIPLSDELDTLLYSLPSDPIDSSLAVLDPLIPPASAFTGKYFPEQVYDSEGNSSYARAVYALLHVLVEDRQIARSNHWALRHILALSIYADDFSNVPSASSAVFHSHASKSNLLVIVSKAQQLATFLLTSSLDDNFHATVIKAVSKNGDEVGLNGISGLLISLIGNAKAHDNIRDTRILRRVFQHIFATVSKDEAGQWMTVARKLEKAAPQTALSIVASITEFAPEPPGLDRYRNELAAGLLGIPASKANTEGLLALRRLAATAPDSDSEIVFLPQLRAINVMKTCQQWVASDEDIEEDIESEMTLVFSHIVPLLQNVSGTHWDFIFDVIENNLENCTFVDDSTLVVLARTLRLIITIQDLASTNKSLRADWQERRITTLTLVRDLIAERSDATRVSIPRSRARELALSTIQDLPTSLVDNSTLSKMCHLLGDSSVEVQKPAYHLLQEAARKRTEHLVIETGVDIEDNILAELPNELVIILQRDLHQENESEFDENDVLGYMLAWMLTFDLFADASMKVRSGYINHLRNLDIVATHFIPSIFNLLHLYDGFKKAFKLEFWAIDEYYIDYYEPGIFLSLQLLASHLFYRALLIVPSLIRKWLLDCTDRQLSTSIVNYTSQHFSPVIIRTELAQVKSPDAATELDDENMSIKVAHNVNEVTASYLVDEHHLEITLKLPNDWPLHTIEIKDLKKVGVLEDRWRSWVLGVQQIIWSQNGRIVDGLSLFKKNVSLHFQGQVECAICYSIISVMDGTLPRKPCRTCKNRFHAACLYKWFNSSHSSSCPLCRSDIM